MSETSSRASIKRRYVQAARFLHRLEKLARRMLGIKKTVYVQERVPFYREMWKTAAEEEGLDFVSLSSSFWEVRRAGERVARLNNYIVSLDDPVTLDMAGDKLLMYELFASAGLPLPRYSAFGMETLDTIERFIERVPGPYVVKPARNTSSGLGVTTSLRTHRQCLSAAAAAFGYCDELIIEQHVVGESYRLLYLDCELLCASRRTGLRVTGDGRQNVEQLSLAELEALGVPATRRDLRRDPDVGATLRAQDLTLQSVPAREETILVRSGGLRREGTKEVRTVYTEDVTNLLCSEIVDQGAAASRALDSEFCGVDIITTDPGVPLQASGGVISEINTTPGLHHHYGLTPSSSQAPLANRVLRYAEKRRRRPS